MDPPHITEFASKRYFEKINQLPKDQQPQQQHHNDNTVVETSSSRFILPIRGAEQQEYIKQEKEREKERRSLFGFGRLRSSKPATSAPEAQAPIFRRQSIVNDVSTSSVSESAAARPRRYTHIWNPKPLDPFDLLTSIQSTLRPALPEFTERVADSDHCLSALVRCAQSAPGIEVMAQHGHIE